jgi:hypothetical protein
MLERGPVTGEAALSAYKVQSTLLYVSRSATAGHFPTVGWNFVVL